jgi:Arc/MetJ-type ribon-helix-helix transcriptional regulator
MDPVQIRLTRELVDKVDKLVEVGLYPNRSEAVRDAVRRLRLIK